jgi:hypothetical protein
MKHWINKNYKTLIIAAFLIPILTVAIVSISHVTQWYGISNPVSWAVYLSIGIEIAALSALAAISANMGKKVYFPFAIVTLVQFIGNIFFAYSYIDINSKSFKDWVDLVSPFVEFIGVDPTDFVGHKRFLAFFAGGMLPVISLSFLHMLVKFTEEDRKNEEKNDESNDPNKLKEFVDENVRLRLSEDDLKKLEEALLNPPPPNENLKKAAEEYKKRGELLAEMMKNDQELGLYDEPFDNPMIKEEIDLNEVVEKLKDREELFPESNQRAKEIIENSVWDVTLMDGLEDEEPFFTEEELQNIIQEEPTSEEEEQNFSTITPNMENIFQDNLTNEEIKEPEFLIPEQEPTVEEEAWTEKMEEQFWEEQVPEPFATPEEVEKFGIDITPIENQPTTINQTLDSANQIIDEEKKN